MATRYVVIGILPIEHKTVIYADSKEEALKKAEEDENTYAWRPTGTGDWKYKILEEKNK